jgi:RecA/RadA recombinase
MKLELASKKQVKLKLQVGGASGSGKTTAALLIAYGLVGDWSKIAVVDSENGSASLYANNEELGIGQFYIIPMVEASPENQIKAMDICAAAGIEAVIIDSGTHTWEWCLDYNSKLAGNSYTNWAITGKKYDAFKKKMLQTPMHVIMTVRKKEDYSMEQDDKGKTKIVKQGLKEISREGMSYEFTTVFDVDATHLTTASKDRTNIFVDLSPFKITADTGKKILEWCNSGTAQETEDISVAIAEVLETDSLEKLTEVYKKYIHLAKQPDFITALKTKKEQF